MIKKIIKYSFIFILIASANLYALAPLDMLENGKRAFELCNWEESREILERFMETWPEHEKYSEALYFYTLASAKTIDKRTEDYRTKLGNNLKNAVASLSLDMPDMDLTEAKVALMIAQKPQKPEVWEELTKLTPKELKHYLLRGWHPNPSETPFETLEWTKTKLCNATDLDSETKSNIALIKLSALWKIMLSPIAKENSKDRLEKLGCLPLDKVFKETVRAAFNNGNSFQKRKAAIFGYHFDYFKANSINSDKKVNSSWLRYLKSRGISSEDTWSPR
ncbi:MAG: hypothetical protein II567_07580 [Candidatus Riflebacteria bacterium]|jgi:hypothetical protein|nr:hypothetical protein [Candidatus Riflebacteria bacterium]